MDGEKMDVLEMVKSIFEQEAEKIKYLLDEKVLAFDIDEAIRRTRERIELDRNFSLQKELQRKLLETFDCLGEETFEAWQEEIVRRWFE